MVDLGYPMIPGSKGRKIDRPLEVAEVADLMVGMLLSWGKLEESALHHIESRARRQDLVKSDFGSWWGPAYLWTGK